MRIDRRLVGFGLFLVTTGIVMIGVRQGLVPAETARRAWNLWPLILVGVGLSMILGRRSGGWVGGLVVAVTAGAIVGGAVGTGSFFPLGACGGNGANGTAFAETGGDFGSTARVSVEQSCGDLDVASADGSHWLLRGQSSDGRPPNVAAGANDVRITSRDSGPFGLDGSSAWSLVLPRTPAIDLDIQANAGDARLALDGANLASLTVQRNAGSIRVDIRHAAAVGRLHLEVNAGSGTLWLPDRSLSGDVTVNAGSLALCLPPGAGLHVRNGDNVAASNDFAAHGLVQAGDAWETSGYATATVQIDLSVDANAASLSLDPTAPCAG